MQCMWKQCEHCPHTGNEKSRQSAVKLITSRRHRAGANSGNVALGGRAPGGGVAARRTDGHADVRAFAA